MYTSQTIDRVRDADIITIVSHFCQDLKRKGASYFCKSPFKTEKTGSFNVNPVKNNWVDYSTNQAGDGIKFVMLHEKCEFPEAIKTIANICGIILEEEKVSEDVKKQRANKLQLTSLAENVAKKYNKQFLDLVDSHWAKKHIAKLGYDKDTVIQFQLGFADNNNTITTACINNAKLTSAVDIGVSKTNNNKSYDFYRERIMFPICNKNGTVVSFGGRSQYVTEAQKKYAKYLNGPETEIYKKEDTLYGFHLAKKSIAKSGFAILTEGYTDVITMHQKGCTQTVATCGTALTKNQVKELKRICEHVILFRDGDAAGVKASIRDIDILLESGFRVSIVPLPNGTDPDDCARGQMDMSLFIEEYRLDALEWRFLNMDITSEDYLKNEKEVIAAFTKEETKLLKNNILINVDALSDKEIKAASKNNTAIRRQIATLKKEANKNIATIEKEDPHKKRIAIKEASEILFRIKDEVVQEGYLKLASKVLNQKQATFKGLISEFRLEYQANLEKTTGKISKSTLGLPEGANHEQYLRDRFCIIQNQYWFTKGDGWFPGTQFRLTPIAHIQGKKENKRLCEVVNVHNQKKLIDFDSTAMINMSEFKKFLINAGVFHFLAGSTTQHFDLMMQKLLKEFFSALELQNLGWNNQGFFAFSNSIFWNDKLMDVNKYGIIHLEGIDKTEEDEHNEKIEYYYSPAYSAMHIKNQDGDDPYENDRKFIYKKAPISLNQWMEQVILVFEEKGRIGILFNFATIFRDLFLNGFDFFPLLGGFGEKGSGKSAFGKVLQNFFFYGLDALELNTSTLVGFSRRLSRTKNTTVFLDEYTDRIEEKMFQGMKGAHQGMGREKGMATNDNRTKTDKINCSIYTAGQYLPTRDDNSLQSRMISLQFPLGNRTSQQRDNFSKLMNWSQQGLSSLVLEVVKHRTLFEDAIAPTYSKVVRELKEELTKPGKEAEYEERVLGNYSALLITYKILEDRIQFPFSYDVIFKQCVAGIIENSEAIQDSNGLTEFWNIIQWMYEHRMVYEGQQFKIDTPASQKVMGAQKKIEVHHNPDLKPILYLRLNSVHQDYLKECTKREGVNPIGETTLRNYFKSRTYFIGLVKGMRFKTGVSSCYAFDYEAMQRNNIVSLEPFKEIIETPEPNKPQENTIPSPTKDEKQDDLPF